MSAVMAILKEMTEAKDAEIANLRAVLDVTHKIITEGALVGFIPTEGTWADRLFKNQHEIFEALKTK